MTKFPPRAKGSPQVVRYKMHNGKFVCLEADARDQEIPVEIKEDLTVKAKKRWVPIYPKVEDKKDDKMVEKKTDEGVAFEKLSINE